MADYTVNNVILGTPSKSHNIMVMSLFEKNKDIFKLLKLSMGSTVNNKAKRFISAYIWDLWTLGQITSDEFDNPRRPGHYMIRSKDPRWKKIYTGGFDDNSGSGIYNKLNNFTPLAVQNHPTYTGQKYSCSFSFSPLINIGFNPETVSTIASTDPEFPTLISDQYEAEQTIYLASRIPMFPLMICSTVPAHYTYGPVFPTNITLTCSGSGNLPIVSVACNFEGGKTITSPPFESSDYKKPTPEPVTINTMNDLNNIPIVERGTLYNFGVDYHRYRSANMVDCMIDFKEYATLGEMRIAMNNNINYPPAFKIIGFDLVITQNIDLQFTYPGALTNNFVMEYFGDKIGPKFAALSERTVSGTITFFSFDKDMVLPNTSGLTMYFGGPFFYAMKYVDWNNPTVNIEPNSGYTHKYTFKARLTDDVSFPQSDNLDQVVSEFTGAPTFSIQSFFDLLKQWFRF